MMSCKNLTDEAMSYLLFCPLLESLNINRTANITDNTIESLIVSSTNLKNLSLSQCPLITSVALKRLLSHSESSIENLNISLNCNIDSSVMQSIVKMEKLSVLNISACVNLRDSDVLMLAEKKGCRILKLNLDNNHNLGNQSIETLKHVLGNLAVSSRLSQQ
jgi:hypothetical protein